MYFPDVKNLGYWHTDFITGKVLWSNEMYRIHGLQPGSTPPSIELLINNTHVDDRDMMCDVIHQATKSLKPFSLFHRIVRKDKSVRLLFSSGSFDIDVDGRTHGRYGICLNLTGLTPEGIDMVRTKLEGFTLPGLAVITTDPQYISMKLLLDIADTVTQRVPYQS